MWQEYCKALPEVTGTYRVLIADVHGHGQRTWNPEDYTGVQIADDMCALIEEVVGEPAVIAGHSSGGLIAALMATRRPDVVRGGVFEDAPFFGPVWSIFTRSVIGQRTADPERLPVIPWVGVGINRIWESLSHPFDVCFTASFGGNSWFRGFDQAQTLSAITCPTTFLKASTRHDGHGNLLAALSDEDLSHVEELLPENQTVRVNSSHDIHFAQTKIYTDALNEFAARV